MGDNGNGAAHKPFLLFGDDDPDTLMMMQMAARLRGWDSDVAASTDEILERVSAHCHEGQRCYDALVLDISYSTGSRVTGVHAVRAIRRKFPNVPVIFITGHSSRLVKEEALRVAQEVIVKPFDPNYVLDRAEVWMFWANTHQGYEGPERRNVSINRSGYYRRASDARIEINERVAAATAPRASTGDLLK